VGLLSFRDFRLQTCPFAFWQPDGQFLLIHVSNHKRWRVPADDGGIDVLSRYWRNGSTWSWSSPINARPWPARPTVQSSSWFNISCKPRKLT
jgi:hypothetical protein